MIWALGLIVFAWGLWLLLDANRFAKHVAKAEGLMAEGLPESTAMEQSGCNYWDKPWHRRLFSQYPNL